MNQQEESWFDSLFRQMMELKEELHQRITKLEERIAELEKHTFNGPGVES